MQNKPSACPHDNVAGEVVMGRRSGNHVCGDCGDRFSSLKEADDAREKYRRLHLPHRINLPENLRDLVKHRAR